MRFFRVLPIFLILIGAVSCTNQVNNPEVNIHPTETGIETVTRTIQLTKTHTVEPTITFTNTAIQPTATITETSTHTPVPIIFPYSDPERCEGNFCIYQGTFLLQVPVSSENNQTIDPSFRYGATQFGKREIHHGVEFVNPTGTKVYAAESGEVVFAGPDSEINFGYYVNNYGNLIIIRHNFDQLESPLYTIYAHLSEIMVETGQHVYSGELIGLVGRTGSALGSHLHFEVRVGENSFDKTSNPDLWLEHPVDEETGLGKGSIAIHINLNNETIYSYSLTIEDFNDPTASYREKIFGETYAYGAPVFPGLNENLVIGDLLPGQYRVSFMREDVSYREIIPVEAGKLTLVEFTIK